MSVHVEVYDDPFDSQRADGERLTIELPFWDEDLASVFWPAVNAPTYADGAAKTAALVRYVWGLAHIEGRSEGVRSILGRDS